VKHSCCSHRGGGCGGSGGGGGSGCGGDVAVTSAK
jgi:hypothetical protein